MKAWKDSIIKDAVIVYRTSHENHQAQNSKFLQEKNVSRSCVWLHRIYNRPIKEIMKEIMDMAKKGGGCEGF